MKATTNREERVETFVSFYGPALKKATEDYPAEYFFKGDAVAGVVSRMRAAFIEGNYNHNARAIKDACKAVGIKHTRKAMEEFFNG